MGLMLIKDAAELLNVAPSNIHRTKRKEMLVSVPQAKNKRFDMDMYNARVHKVKLFVYFLREVQDVLRLMHEDGKYNLSEIMRGVHLHEQASAELYKNRVVVVKTYLAIQEFMPILTPFYRGDDITELFGKYKLKTYKSKAEVEVEMNKVIKEYLPFYKEGERLIFKIYGE